MDLLLLLQTAGPIQTASSPAFSLPPPLLPAVNFAVPFPNPRLSPLPFTRLHANVRRSIAAATSLSPTSPPASASPLKSPPRTHWLVVMEKPPTSASSKPEIVDYYVQTLARVLGSEKEAQMCIYDASWRTHFGFCCDIDEQSALELARVPGVVSVRPDKDPESKNKDYSYLDEFKAPLSELYTSAGNSEYWIVRMDKPGFEVISKAQMVDYYAQTLMKVMGNERDAQVSIYNISWEKDYGFCCRIDEECARELADVPGVLSVRPDLNFESENKDYRGDAASNSKLLDSSEAIQSPEIKTKRLFVTGLSFYTSEKTLRAAFEGFGELVEVKIIMDKISKRSKGYAFIEYTTEESAGAALKEMNGKIINGWMIVVDVAKTNPPKYSRGRPQP